MGWIPLKKANKKEKGGRGTKKKKTVHDRDVNQLFPTIINIFTGKICTEEGAL